MQKQSMKTRKGDSSRTSSQGRKESSGGTLAKKKGNPDVNEDTRNAVKEEKPKRRRIPAGAITK
jgi:hypothetical protein